MPDSTANQTDQNGPNAERAALDDWQRVYNSNITLAAVGNRDAQAAIAHAAFGLALNQGGGEMMAAARWWARIAAAHGFSDDRFVLAGVLAMSSREAVRTGSIATAEAYQDEALRALAPLVSAGDLTAIEYANQIAGGPKPVVVMIPDQPEWAQYLWAADMEGQA